MTAQLLTVDEFRQHVETALADEAIQRLLDSAEDDINRNCGTLNVGDYETLDEITEWHTLSQYETVIYPRQRYASITSVSEYFVNSDSSDEVISLTEDDEFWADGFSAIRRKVGYFNKRVKIVYAPYSTINRRRAVIIQLCKLEINADPGTSFEGAGTWQHTTQDYEAQRQHLLWSLCPPPVFA